MRSNGKGESRPVNILRRRALRTLPITFEPARIRGDARGKQPAGGNAGCDHPFLPADLLGSRHSLSAFQADLEFENLGSSGRRKLLGQSSAAGEEITQIPIKESRYFRDAGGGGVMV